MPVPSHGRSASRCAEILTSQGGPTALSRAPIGPCLGDSGGVRSSVTMRGFGSGRRDRHCGDWWLLKGARDGEVGRGSESAAADDAAVVVERCRRGVSGHCC